MKYLAKAQFLGFYPKARIDNPEFEKTFDIKDTIKSPDDIRIRAGVCRKEFSEGRWNNVEERYHLLRTEITIALDVLNEYDKHGFLRPEFKEDMGWYIDFMDFAINSKGILYNTIHQPELRDISCPICDGSAKDCKCMDSSCVCGCKRLYRECDHSLI